jgi:hypothetical protein
MVETLLDAGAEIDAIDAVRACIRLVKESNEGEE